MANFSVESWGADTVIVWPDGSEFVRFGNRARAAACLKDVQAAITAAVKTHVEADVKGEPVEKEQEQEAPEALEEGGRRGRGRRGQDDTNS